MISISSKRASLQERLTNIGSMVIAYSGGVDSSLLLAVAHSLKECSICAVTVKTEFGEKRELDAAIKNVPKEVRHLVIEEHILGHSEITANPSERCYLCKRLLFAKILNMAREHGYSTVVEGSNADDANDYRPGARALHELKIISPLKEVGLTKEEIRVYARELNVQVWDKPANPCLATRIPYGTTITREKLLRIEKAENLLHDIGLFQVRVRDHGEIARIEIPQKHMQEFFSKDIQGLIHTLKSYGYSYITLDLEGYRMGSMNDVLIV